MNFVSRKRTTHAERARTRGGPPGGVRFRADERLENAGREDEALRGARRSGCVGDSSAVKTVLRLGGDGRLGLAGVGEDPVDDCRGISARGEDRGSLDDLAAGSVRASKAGD